MKSLGKTIDKILKVLPSLEPHLIPIKSKWKKYPGRTSIYWKELTNTLTTEEINGEVRDQIKGILNQTPQRIKPKYTFEEVLPGDKIIGVLPEHLSDRIKYQDVVSVRIAMLQTKAALTKDRDLIVQLSKQASRLDIAMKKLWYDIKEGYNLWDKDIKVSIKRQNSLLVLVDDTPPLPPIPHGDHALLKIDLNTLGGLFRMLGLDPPPGF